jgi:hypothetical protein
MHSLPPYQPYQRDLNTLRGVVHDSYGPPPATVSNAPAATTKGSSLLIAAIGMLLGSIVGVVALRNAHAAPPIATASAPIVVTAAVVAPPPPPVVQAKAAEPAPTVGTVSVDGPAGANVFDGNQLVGQAPLTFSTSLGHHQIKVVDPTTKQKTTTSTLVTDKSVASVHVEFKRKHVGGGGVFRAPQTAGTKPTGGPSQADMKAAEDDLRAAQNANALGGGS